LASSNDPTLPLEALGLQTMASGHLCLELTERVDWWGFPGYARELVSRIGGEIVSFAESAELRIWDISVDGDMLGLVYQDYPQMISLESNSDRSDALLQRLNLLLGPEGSPPRHAQSDKENPLR